ncbi:glycosyltransferase [Flavobacterium reichenbachii]|uniref:Alpha-1,4-N-acetylgalactosamine transferase n=1 Tax=Flavobacterium reichenbachii TaxID=362418 RepID=A0A085ZL78_9FLAO|nr:glycosyltransferase [Flavobacterium reichenbachii]KFF05192.1 alpha-1,4-N-acetylgalactosamine transferase [Flavobacterium reichenbachii]OXB16145.1 alpha-1,4-N-acetylgalactosamine transferase [Flavobacterium reichenbachii]
MRVVQIIDSLALGGAEKMAVNFANALADEVEFSGLIATRKEGDLLNQINKNVSYLFLNRKKQIDFNAIFRLRTYLKKNKVDIIHAHSSSFFTAVLVKFTLPGIKIVWHDHYGPRIRETKKENKTLIALSYFFSSVLTVNLQLQDWNIKNMHCKKVFFLPNFVSKREDNQQLTTLNGNDNKRIVFLANLKDPKNHLLIVKSFHELKLEQSGWSLHLIGKDYFDSYSDNIKKFINSNSLQNHIHLYGSKNDVNYILSQSTVGVLASTDEGFPVTLLEYAMAQLAVVSTNAGYCSQVIQDGFNGLLFDPLNDLEVKSQLKKVTDDELLRKNLSVNFRETVIKNYSKDKVIEKLIAAYKN